MWQMVIGVNMKLSKRIMAVLAAGLLLVTGAIASAAPLTWDSNPANAVPNDGSGNWGAGANNANWWNGAANVSWNNAGNDIAVPGVNTANAATVTLTNNVTVGGIIYSNSGTGIYTIGESASLTVHACESAIELGGRSGTHANSPSLVAHNGLGIMASTSNAGAAFRAAAAARNISGLLVHNATWNYLQRFHHLTSP